MSRLVQLARLNGRVAALALRGQWVTPAVVAAGYDCVAPTYDSAWHRHLRPATDDLLQRLPGALKGVILDLGSGTGYTARRLAQANPAASVVAVDVSAAMLEHARQQAPANLRFAVSDMLDFMRCQSAASAALIVSTWALGYSHPARLFRECSRVLSSGGRFAFIVNYADTLAPVFRAFQCCLVAFPSRVRLAAWPRFPRNWASLERQLRGSGFVVEWHEEGSRKITAPGGQLLPWLRQTGILAGFDSMLDLSGPVAARFETELARGRDDIYHHFAMAIARKL
ncbi:MAG TPA: class I SAM-dependent methyltransferase [Verrucomicrobiota bacterium]|nr:class I SAM-dependent methyltransferase [Verrucomicrobiota bacterium]HQL77774.1 class I SAM-dependent methyltransferase [Verrucomicrobiota bacterium]